MKVIHPPHWPKASGFSHGIAASGRLLCIAGQIAWNDEHKIVSDEFVPQVEQALKNIVAVLDEADAKPEHITRMTWYIKNKEQYITNTKQVGEVYRKHIGKHYPAMSLLVVKDLLEDEALVEIEATAVIPE